MSILFSIEFSFLIRYYNLLYQSLIPNCKLTINTLCQHISISDNIEQYIVGATSHRTSCQRLINFLLTHLYSEKDYMQFCYNINIISVMTDLPYRLVAGISYVRIIVVTLPIQKNRGCRRLWQPCFCNCDNLVFVTVTTLFLNCHNLVTTLSQGP